MILHDLVERAPQRGHAISRNAFRDEVGPTKLEGCELQLKQLLLIRGFGELGDQRSAGNFGMLAQPLLITGSTTSPVSTHSL